METLLGNLNYRFNDLIKLSEYWTTNLGANISIKKEWDIFTTIKPDPLINKFSGGKDGRLIARYEIAFTEQNHSIVTLYDHKLNEIATCHIEETCKDIFIYVSKKDELRVVTASGRLFTFQGETQISSVPILCPELEPTPDANNPESMVTRNREILDVAFWETGFVYIDRDGNVVQYDINPSQLTTTNYVQGNFTSQIYDFDKQYLKNIQNPNEIRTKILAKSTKLDKPVSFDCIPPEFTQMGDSPYVLIVDQDSNIHIITSTDHNTVKTVDQIYALSISPSYKFVAFIVHPMILMVMPISLDQIYIQIELSQGDTFEQISWAGDDIPIVSFSDTTLLALSSGDLIEVPTEGKSVLFQQSDCALVLTDKALFRVGIVNSSVERCLGLASSGETAAEDDTILITKVNSLLESSLLDLQTSDCREVKIIVTPPARLIRSFCQYSPAKVIQMKNEGTLQDAIKECINAAKYIPCPSIDEEKRLFTTKQSPSSLLLSGNPTAGSNGQYKNAHPQTILMASACFGKTLLMMPCGNVHSHDQDALNSINEEYIKVARWIRLANMFKKQLNISISPYDLMENVSIDEAIARLCLRGLFSPAFEVADDFGADKAAIITRWCCTVMNTIQDDDMCFNALMQMKKLHMPSIVTSSNQSMLSKITAQQISSLAKNKLKSSRNISPEPQNLLADKDQEVATTCALFDTASIASAASRLGRLDLALSIARSEKNAKLVIPFYAASGMWKEAVNASVFTCDSNIFIEVLRRAIVEIGSDDVIQAIGQNYFSYASIQKLTFRPPKPTRSEATTNAVKHRGRIRKVSSLNQENAAAITNAQKNFIDTLDTLLQGVELTPNNIDLYLTRKLQYMNCWFNVNHEPIHEAKETLQVAADSLSTLHKQFRDTPLVESQSTLMNDQLILCQVYEMFVQNVQNIAASSKNTDPEVTAKIKQLASLDMNSLTANKLIEYAVDLHQLSSLILIAEKAKLSLINANKAIIISARYLAKHDRFDDFVNLLLQQQDFIKQDQEIATAIAFHNFGKDSALAFVDKIQDPKKKAQLNDIIKKLSTQSQEIYGSKELNCLLFKSTKSLF